MTKYSPRRRTGADAVGGSARAGLNAAVRRRRRSEPHAHFPAPRQPEKPRTASFRSE
jgi:hypothetical protein